MRSISRLWRCSLASRRARSSSNSSCLARSLRLRSARPISFAPRARRGFCAWTRMGQNRATRRPGACRDAACSALHANGGSLTQCLAAAAADPRRSSSSTRRGFSGDAMSGAGLSAPGPLHGAAGVAASPSRVQLLAEPVARSPASRTCALPVDGRSRCFGKAWHLHWLSAVDLRSGMRNVREWRHGLPRAQNSLDPQSPRQRRGSRKGSSEHGLDAVPSWPRLLAIGALAKPHSPCERRDWQGRLAAPNQTTCSHDTNFFFPFVDVHCCCESLRAYARAHTHTHTHTHKETMARLNVQYARANKFAPCPGQRFLLRLLIVSCEYCHFAKSKLQRRIKEPFKLERSAQRRRAHFFWA